MKSARWERKDCHRCRATGILPGTNWSAIWTTMAVQVWVSYRVAESSFVYGYARRCVGCSGVAEDRYRVLGNLLAKLGIKYFKDGEVDDNF